MNILSLWIEVICLLASCTLFFQRSVPPYLKLFLPFMAITIVVETIGYYRPRGVDLLVLYDLFTTFEIEFYLYIISHFLHKRKLKTLITYILFIYPVLVILNMLFIQTETFHTMTYSVGCLLIVPACIYYFYEIFRVPKFVDLKREPAFWICSGVLFFYCCSFPLLGLINFLTGMPEVIIKNLYSILAILNLLLYSLFSIAFLYRVRFPTFKRSHT